ncbi:hypothetical protein I4U23_000744 [Adineta vaga]|nr:hypothetical protein I4U23_000744 [Adineta vaga]
MSIKLRTSWTHGSKNCFKEDARRRYIDEFSINADTFVLRENKCINYEAPFLYLLFSSRTVLLIDTGATVSSVSFPIQQKQGRQRQDMILVVIHSHNHRDHTAGDVQFQSKNFTTLIRASVAAISRFFHLENWPRSIGTYALDYQRRLVVIPIPGHEMSSLAFYDCSTGLLFTGDSFYPGRLYISNFTAYVQSISRLVEFIEFNNLYVTAILGTHIEMTQTPQIDYPTGTTYQPNERQLDLSFEQLKELNYELQNQWKNGFHQRHRAFHNAFIIDPNPSELPLLSMNEHFSNHQFLLLSSTNSDHVLIFYMPMFKDLVDFQLVFLAKVNNSTEESFLLSEENHAWTIESHPLSLNNLINGNLTSFSAKLHQNDTEDNLENITINIIHPFLTINQLNSSEIEPYQSLRYISYPLLNSTKLQIHLYLLHQLRVQPHFDALVHVMIDPTNCTSDIDRNQLNKLIEQNGNEWVFHELENDIIHRLTSGYATAQLLGDIYSTICTMQFIKEVQCRFFSDYETLYNDSSKQLFHYQLNTCQLVKMVQREVNTNYRDEDKVFHGFLPIWAIVLFGIAILFIMMFLAGLICYLIGCLQSQQDSANNMRASMLEQPLLIDNNQLQTSTMISNELSQKSRDHRF